MPFHEKSQEEQAALRCWTAPSSRSQPGAMADLFGPYIVSYTLYDYMKYWIYASKWNIIRPGSSAPPGRCRVRARRRAARPRAFWL